MEVLTSADAARCRALHEGDEFFWADLVDPSTAELEALGAALGLHRLALEDTHEFGQPPKLDHYEDHVLLVFFSAREAPELTDVTFAPIEWAEGAVVSQEDLLDKAWDENIDPFTNVVRVTMMTLRKKLGEPQVIETVPGVGYKL